jgi:ribokinase
VTRNILVIGSANVDYVAFVDNAPRPGETVTGTRFAMHGGGKGANQAFAAARLGAPSTLVARVGHDAQGAWLKAQLAAGGVDTRHVIDDEEASTGVALIVVDRAGENSIVVAPGANGRLSVGDLETRASLVAEAAVVLLQLEVPIETVQAAALRARAEHCTVLLDPAPARPLPDALLALADYVTPNETELRALAGESAPAGATAGRGQGALSLDEATALGLKFLDRGSPCVVAKLGAAGALLIRRQERLHVPAPRVAVADTTAAGDVFNAALAVALAAGSGEADALRYATTSAALSVTREGAQSSMPSAAEVDRWRPTVEL